MEYKESILLVDDERDIRDTLSEILTLKGYFPIACSDGHQAIAKLRDKGNNIGIVITDINMPKMSGLELLKTIHQTDENIIKIIITAYATRDAAIEALKYGAYDFIKKPFNIMELTLILKRAVEKRLLILENIEYQKHLEDMVKLRTQQIEELNYYLKDLNKLGIENRKDTILSSKLNNVNSFIQENFKADSYALLLYDQSDDRFTSFFHNTHEENSRLDFDRNSQNRMLELLYEKGRAPMLAYDSSDPEIYDLRLFSKDRKLYIFPFSKDIYTGCVYLGFYRSSPKIQLDTMLKPMLRELESALENNYLIQKHNDELKKMFLSSVQTHAHTIEAKDPYTKGHCNRVEIYSQIIAMELNMTEEERYELQIACLLHDIGKIGVSERILSKPSRLTDEEMDQMKLHPVIGGEIVKDLYGFNIAPIIKHHHERYDGKGYPEGLLGDNIPLGARIIAVADTFDAMTSDRPYRKSLDREIAINELIVFKGKQFDPKMVDAFLNKPEKIEKLHNNLKKMKFNQLTSLISFQDIK